jgi:protein tyrosine phosphatase
MQGYRQRNAFILTQAPMSNTTGDFWKMIWEQKSAAIVMLTELEEDGKVTPLLTDYCV